METNGQTRTIGRSLLISITIAVIAICVGLGTVGYRTFSDSMTAHYQVYLRDLLNMTSTRIDGDDLAACIESGQESEAFKEADAYLDAVKETHNIEYVYIVVPLNDEAVDNMMNVMCGVTAAERAEDEEYYSVRLGELTGDSNPPDVAAKFLAGMDSSEVTFFGNDTEFGYMYTGMVAIRDSAGKAVAILAADVSMSVIHQRLQSYLTFVFAYTLILAAIVVIALYRWLRRRVVDPLARLEDVSERFVASSHVAASPDELVVADPNIHTGDEMEALSNSLDDMFDRMKRYMTDMLDVAKEKERIGAELDIATQIQKDMLPCIFPAFPGRSEFDIYASMDPAKEVGGDFYDFFLVDDDHLGLVIADVSSKGVPAALFMVIAKTLLKDRLQTGERPAEALENVNNQLAENNEAHFFVTVWAAVLEISTGRVVAVNAGHEHPAIRRSGGSWELDIYKHSLAVGIFEGIPYREHTFQLYPGDRVFVYTDGVPESQNAAGELYRTERMIAALNAAPDNTPEKLVKYVRADVDAFVGEAEQFDDLTILCLQYDGPKD